MRTMEEILQGMDEKEFIVYGRINPAFWIERVLGLTLKPFHREWIDMFLSHDRVVIVAPTGHGKTAIFGVAIPLWLAFYNRRKQILIVSNVIDQSVKILERIKTAIATNELLKILEPEQKDKLTWTKTEINTSTKCKIFCKPYNENIRSFHVDYVICDEAAQYKDHSIFERWVITRVTAKGGKLAVISTPVSAIDLPNKLLKNPVFVGKVYSAFDKEGKPIFPELYSEKRLEEIKQTMGSIRFRQEYMCDVVAMEDAFFPPNLVLNAFDEKLDFKSESQGGRIYIGADFAVGTGKDVDYTVFTVVETEGDKYYIRKIERYKGMPISAQIRRLESLYNQYRPEAIYLDESTFGVTILQELRSKQIRAVGCKFDFASRNNYLMNLRKILEDGKLVIPRKAGGSCLALTDKLYKELTSFIVTKTPSGATTYKTTAAHDDMVMSLALALSGIKPVKRPMNKAFFTFELKPKTF